MAAHGRKYRKVAEGRDGARRFEPREALELVRRGEEDAWRALERAGWLEPATDAGAPPAS